MLPVGGTVTVCWDPAHTFGLDGSQDAAAGTGTGDGVPVPRSGGPARVPGVAELSGSAEPAGPTGGPGEPPRRAVRAGRRAVRAGRRSGAGLSAGAFSSGAGVGAAWRG